MEVRGLDLSLANAWSAGALSMPIDMLVDRGASDEEGLPENVFGAVGLDKNFFAW